MGTGYTRNDASNNIANGNVIDAADLDGEFDAIESAFGTSGHSHDGTSAEGGAITNLGPSQEFRGDGSSLYPKADATYDLGKSNASFSTAYVEGINLAGTGITASATEINYTDGVTSAIQTQLNGKQAADSNIVSDANYVRTDQNFTNADHTKLDGIETGATADQTAAEIRALVASATDSQVFTDADHTKLNGIATGATNTVGNATHTGDVTGSTVLSIGNNKVTPYHLNVSGNGTTTQYLRSDGDGSFTWATPPDTNTTYTHPTHPGDDASVDTGALTGATVISDLDFNITTDTNGHVTDANATVATRNLTLANLGYTGATNANAYTHPSYNGDDFSVDTGALTGATVVSDIDINVTTDASGHVTDANGSVATRTLTLANLGYTGATNANNYSHPTGAGNNHIPSGGSTDQILKYSSSGTAVWATPAAAGATFPDAPTWTSPQSTFTSSGTWTKPGSIADDDWVIFYMVGGGGGAGWTNTYGGGAGGANVIAVLGADVPSTVSFTIGGGGGSGGHNNGANGGITSMTAASGYHYASGGGGAPYQGFGSPGASADNIITSSFGTLIPRSGTHPWVGYSANNSYSVGRGAPSVNTLGSSGGAFVYY